MYYNSFIKSAEDSYIEFLNTLEVVDKNIITSDPVSTNRLYSALLISLYSTFETHLISLCDLYYKTGLIDLKVSDLAGNNYIEKAFIYLQLTGYLSFDKKDPTWKEIQTFQSIRNLITHNQMNIVEYPEKPIEKQRLFLLVSRNESFYFDITNGGFQLIKSSYLKDTTQKCSTLIKKITHDLDKKRVIVRNRTLPYDMTAWGIEKTEALIGNIISLMNLQKKKYSQSEIDEFTEETLHSSLWNLTKFLALFYDGEWKTTDPKVIIEHQEKGLQILIDKYKN